MQGVCLSIENIINMNLTLTKTLLALFFLFTNITLLKTQNADILKGNQKDNITPERQDSVIPDNKSKYTDHIRSKAGKEITDKFPTTRFLDVEYEYVTPSDYKLKLHEKGFNKGSLQHQNRIKIALNVPIYKIKGWTFTGSVRYKYSHFELNDMRNISADFPDIYPDRSSSTHFYNTTLNTTYMSRLFNKPIIYNFGISGEGSGEGYERITGMAIAMMVLKKNQNTTITAGLILIADKMSIIPVIPTFTVDHKLSNTWSLSMALPRYIYFRRPLFTNGRLSLGTNMDSENFYVYPKESSKTFLYRKLEIKSGFVYEHSFRNRFILTVKGGALNAVNGKLMQKNKSSNKEILKSTQNMNAYFNIGFSYNLFK